MTTIFLSHSSDDMPMVRKLARDLENLGIRVWLDDREIQVGDSIPSTIQDGISKCDLLALWVTPAALASAWVPEEWQTMYVQQLNERKKLVYPLLAGHVVLPPFLAHRKYADFRKSYMVGFGELALALGKYAEFEESLAVQIQGDWEGESGKVGRAHFVVQGTRVRASYQWLPLDTEGRLLGDIVAGRLVCEWFTNGGTGCCMLELQEDRLVGAWWGDGAGPSHLALLNGAEPTEGQGVHQWSFRRAIRK